VNKYREEAWQDRETGETFLVKVTKKTYEDKDNIKNIFGKKTELSLKMFDSKKKLVFDSSHIITLNNPQHKHFLKITLEDNFEFLGEVNEKTRHVRCV